MMAVRAAVKISKKPSSISGNRFFPRLIIYACLLPPMAGAASPTTGRLPLMAQVKLLL
jgi:hypothetical protein